MHRQYDTLEEGYPPGCGVLNHMRLLALLFTVVCITSPALAQPPGVSAAAAAAEDTTPPQATQAPAGEHQLPVSVDRIREALNTTPLLSLRTVDERPTFRIQVEEKRKLEELLATLKFKPVPVPAGGIRMAEQNRIMFPSVDNPLRQEFAAFSQSQLLTILIENLIGKYAAGKALNSLSHAERARAEDAAKDEVRAAVAQYCGAQPHEGAGIQICDTPVR